MSKKTQKPAAEPVAVDAEKVPETEVAAAAGPAPEATPPDVADPAPEAAAAIVTHEIAGAPEKGFYRAGRYWPRAGITVNRSDFTDDQWAALEGEPKLTIKPL